MEQNNIIFSNENGIATLRFNRPKSLNALCGSMNRAILDAIESVKNDLSIRAFIITGNEKAFAAGADISEMMAASPRLAREISTLAIDINNVLESMHIPTIAAVNGYAWGGGFEMALACDFRIGGPHTSFCFPEVGLGIIPGANGTARITSIVGASKAKEIIMLCQRIKGEEALKLGLLNRFVEDTEVYNEAVRFAMELAIQPGCALTAAKNSVNTAALKTVEDGKVAERTEFPMLFDTHDQKEGMIAFLEKRSPNYINN